jgi:hypothetical protein
MTNATKEHNRVLYEHRTTGFAIPTIFQGFRGGLSNKEALKL